MASISSLAITHSHVITYSGHFENVLLNEPEGLMKIEERHSLHLTFIVCFSGSTCTLFVN